MIQKVQAVFNQAFDNDSDDVDTQLYNGFFSAQDKNNFEIIRNSDIQKIQTTEFQFKDKRADMLVQRYIARNYPESLSNTEKQDWLTDIKHRLSIRFGQDAHLWLEKLSLMKTATLNPEQSNILDLVEIDSKQKFSKIF